MEAQLVTDEWKCTSVRFLDGPRSATISGISGMPTWCAGNSDTPGHWPLQVVIRSRWETVPY